MEQEALQFPPSLCHLTTVIGPIQLFAFTLDYPSFPLSRGGVKFPYLSRETWTQLLRAKEKDFPELVVMDSHLPVIEEYIRIQIR